MYKVKIFSLYLQEICDKNFNCPLLTDWKIKYQKKRGKKKNKLQALLNFCKKLENRQDKFFQKVSL